MGAEGSVTLQLREAIQAPDASGSTLDHGGLTIGYPDPEMLADMLGSFQSASAGAAGLDQSVASTFDLLQQDSSNSNCSRQSDVVEHQQQQQQHIASALLAAAKASSSPSGSGSGSLTLSGIKSEIGELQRFFLLSFWSCPRHNNLHVFI